MGIDRKTPEEINIEERVIRNIIRVPGRVDASLVDNTLELFFTEFPEYELQSLDKIKDKIKEEYGLNIDSNDLYHHCGHLFELERVTTINEQYFEGY